MRTAPAVDPQVVAQHDGDPVADGEQAGAHLEQRRLAGPVGPGQQDDLAPFHREVDAGEGGEPAEERHRGSEVDHVLHSGRQRYWPLRTRDNAPRARSTAAGRVALRDLAIPSRPMEEQPTGETAVGDEERRAATARSRPPVLLVAGPDAPDAPRARGPDDAAPVEGVPSDAGRSRGGRGPEATDRPRIPRVLRRPTTQDPDVLEAGEGAEAADDAEGPAVSRRTDGGGLGSGGSAG